MDNNTLVLIGMPGSGKTTTARALSLKFDMEFIDTDALLVDECRMPLGEYVKEYGREAFLDFQEKVITSFDFSGYVVATGGSVVYSEKIMKHLAGYGTIIYLQLDFEEMEKRLGSSRKLARNKDQSLEDMYFERKPLYEKYAQLTIDCNGRDTGSIVEEISAKLSEKAGGKEGIYAGK